jgi:hypothetical protein
MKNFKQLTKKELRVLELNRAISANRELFTLGNTITEDQFLTMFNLPALTSFTAVAEVMRHSLRKVKVQGEVNKLLSMRGLYLKSCEFGSTYFLLSKKGLENKLDSYQAQAYRRKESQMRLSEGIIKHKSKWEKLSLEEITIVSQSVFDFDKINNA